MRLLEIIEDFFLQRAPLVPGDIVLVAFSGGTDSTALLWGLKALSPRLRIRVAALHLDHGTDPGSSDRARHALEIAARLDIPCRLEHLEVPDRRLPGEAIEEAGRRLRYLALEAERRRLGARYLATAHHRDDQTETIALRLSLGSGIEGLAGILACRGPVVRPLLALPRAEVLVGLSELQRSSGAPRQPIAPLHDPTNDDDSGLRNRWRHWILPHIETESPGASAALARLGERAERARARIEALLLARLRITPLTEDGEYGLSVPLEPLLALPRITLSHALAALHRRAGAAHPPGAGAQRELLRQLRRRQRGAPLGCDCGSGWRWAVHADRFELRLSCPPEREGPSAFTYTLRIPGAVEIREISVRMSVTLGESEAPEPQSGRERVALALPVQAGDRLTVRNRRPGDRLQPLGAPGSRRLKEVLIDRRVPRRERDRLPLLCWGDRIAWVPGVTVDQSFRPLDSGTAWIAEIRRA